MKFRILALLVTLGTTIPTVSNATPVTYEIGVRVTSYTFLDPLRDSPDRELQIGEKAMFRVTFDRERCLDGCDTFAARLLDKQIDGVWTSLSVEGFGLDESQPGQNRCGTHSEYGCSALVFAGGPYAFFSNWAIEHWFDPTSLSGLRGNSPDSYFFCNIRDCSLGGTGQFTFIRTVPEPGPLLPLAAGLGGLLLRRKQAAGAGVGMRQVKAKPCG